MKTRSLTAVVAVLSFALLPLSVPAQLLYWDPDGAIFGTSVSGNWDTVTTNWTPVVDSNVNMVWSQGSDASFVVDADYTVTLSEPITIGNFAVSGSAGTLTIAGTTLNNLTLGGAGSTFDITGSRTNTVSAPITGSSALTKSGGGTLTLSGANTWSGGTIISSGSGFIGIAVDTVSSGGVITSGPLGTGPITVNNAGHRFFASGGARVVENPVILNAGVTTVGSENLTFRGGDWQVVGGTRILTVSNTALTVFESNLTDDGTARTFQKAGPGRLVMSPGGPTSYLGGITASAGTLLAGNSTPFPTNNNNQITINASTLDLNGFDVRLSRLAGNAAGSVLLGTNTLTAGNNASSATFSGVMSGTGGYVKVGTISQVLSGTNTFTGGILITEGPVYFPTNGGGSPYSLGPGPNVITITNTGSWGANVVGTSIITNKVVLANVGPTAIMDPAGGGTVIWYQAGEISGTGGLLRSTKGSGVVILSASNTFSGGVQMDARLLGLGHKNALGTGAFTIGNPTTPPGNPIELAATLDLIGANAITNNTTVNRDFTFNSTLPGAESGLELGGPITLASGTKVITASGTGVAKISGVMGGDGGINKDGANTLTLSANNSYTGSTIVSNGTLALTGSGTVAGSGDLLVLSGGTLDASGRTDGTLTVGAAQTLRGSGTVVGTVTVAGTLAPGNSIGMLTVNGTLNLNHKAWFELDKSQAPANDFVIVNGTLNGGGTLTVTNAGAGLLTAGDMFVLFNQGVSGFAAVNLPPGYLWDNQLAASGMIAVLGTTFPTTPTNITTSVSGGNLTLNWPANYAGGWVLETSVDLTNWVTVEGSRDVSSMSFPIDPAQPMVFYRQRLLTQ